MTDAGLSVRALGRLINPADPEHGRLTVQRHLRGVVMPSPTYRAAYRRALNLPEGALEPDDEEAEPVDIDARLGQLERDVRDVRRAMKASR